MLQAQIGAGGRHPVPRSPQDRPAELVAMFLWIKETRPMTRCSPAWPRPSATSAVSTKRSSPASAPSWKTHHGRRGQAHQPGLFRS